jgi:hypothetical protein
MIHQQIKELFFSSVEHIVSDISQYAVHPDSDFKRSKKIPAQKLISFLISQGSSSTRVEMFYPQLGVKLCSMAGGGVQKIYMVFLREPSRRDRSGSDLFHLRDGFEIKMNFDRNVSCFIFVNALMHDDFFD